MKKGTKITLIVLCSLILVLCGTALALYSLDYMGFEDGKLKFYFDKQIEEPDEPIIPEEPEDTRFTINLVWVEGGKEQTYKYNPVTSTFSPKIQETWAKLSANSGKLYRFDGWYMDELYHDVADPKDIKDGDTLYAKMIEQVTVTIHNIYPGNKTSNQEVVVDKYSIFSLDSNLSLTTAEFFGVYKDSNKSETATDFPASANTDIYAYWSSKYSDFKWETDSTAKTAKITEYKGKSSDVVIPAVYVKNKTNFTVTEIGSSAFNDSDITSVAIPDGVTSIGNNAFQSCSSLTSVTISNNVTSIGGYAFAYCTSLTGITIPNSVANIGWFAFQGCTSLTAVYITDIASWCGIDFDVASNPLDVACNLYLNGELVVNLVIPDGVSSIGNYAFYDCSGLTSITIPDSVTSIGYDAFYNCASLTSVTIQATTPSSGGRIFYNCSSLTNIYVPAESVDAYKSASGWSSYADKIQAIQE